jgi:hypothetical protein
LGHSGLFSFFGPSEIGSPWSSLPHSTGRVAFHPVRFRYGTGGINFFGLFGPFGYLSWKKEEMSPLFIHFELSHFPKKARKLFSES